MAELKVIRTHPKQVASNVEAEQQVLGCLLLDRAHSATVIAAGGGDLFFDPVHAELFNMIVQRDRDGMYAGSEAFVEWADNHEGMQQLGGKRYLANMMGFAVSPRDLQGYCEILSDLTAKRNIMAAIEDATKSITAGDDSAPVIASRLEVAIGEQQGGTAPKPVSMTAAVSKALEQAIAAKNGEAGDSVPTGIERLDGLVTGFYGGELILLGGRPSMGKTSVALNIALNAARAGHGVVICSLEMNPEAMALRALSEETGQMGKGIAYRDIRAGNMNDTQMQTVGQAAKTVSELPIQFLSRQYSDIGAMLAGAKQANRLLGDNMKLLVVDYAQLLKSKANNRYEQITEISIALKNLAGQMNVPVLALSQLSRAVEQRDDKRPMLSDLRESGQLEQDADAVLFCYRDQYYLEREEPDDMDKHEAWQDAMRASENKLEIIVAKQRQGPIGTAHVYCNVGLNRIWEPYS